MVDRDTVLRMILSCNAGTRPSRLTKSLPLRIEQRLWFRTLTLALALLPQCAGREAATPAVVAPARAPCLRFPAGSVVHNPPALFSRNGSLAVNFSYQTRTDSDGRVLFGFMTPEGLQNPTLPVQPADHLIINLTNNTPASPVEVTLPSPNACGDIVMTPSSTNLHYHGTNTSPTCGQDEVVHTIINSGQTFRYDVRRCPTGPLQPGQSPGHHHDAGIG